MKNNITFVGLDVHATSLALAVLPPGAEVPVEREIPNDPKLIRRRHRVPVPLSGRPCGACRAQCTTPPAGPKRAA